MTRLLVIRHGQSQTNVDGIFAGKTDSALSELGQRQAETTAAYIVSHYRVDKVYASGLRRAYATGKAVADRLGLAVHIRGELEEIDGGAWECVPFAELTERTAYQVWLTDVGNAVCDGGESVARLQKRVVDAVLEIAEENPGKTVVIATHATPVRALQCWCEGKSLAQMREVPWTANASVTEIIYENGALQPVMIGYDRHLGGMVSRLPAEC